MLVTFQVPFKTRIRWVTNTLFYNIVADKDMVFYI